MTCQELYRVLIYDDYTITDIIYIFHEKPDKFPYIIDKINFIRYNIRYMCRMQKAGGIMRHKKSVMRSFMMVTQLGISVMVPVFVCILAGYYIDRYAGTKLTLLFLFLGFLAGGLNAYKLAKSTLAMNEREERAEDQKERMERQEEARPKVHKPKQPSRVKTHDDEKLS